ncbi:protein SUPPRESSOR OF MAX2 1 [Cynara cardunculus var. scolymus]|uniref:Double Clp-N motif-containing protein n=1 Tax=Cynara cardunculus var. scolymus TaxID=59895 RepID=A0A118JW80_CYNCS|nr:protein SUPPRESSOR OF MAX2 1 [Cynara cardunculus var. scolymus]XP_024978928.1 protein SUPPRESSOR OF MAX2 1 [Cynara cardunculus var. scolymus]KVH93655.1 Double Clp-N motif-containing protein [Cynara cardunculus var. scolymus]
MRAGLSTIQQTLTPEAATVLNHSIAEAGRRNHGQTTPLHVASTLLASPTGFLRQACIRSHPNSSHPLQCRALELCFSVALERLPTATSSPAVTEPPISNALMAALKRAQAHQRRGCPEQQQQPLLAVKVELEQLIISILDDPSVSRVMREASFSSPAVKATIEESLSNNNLNPSSLGVGFRPSPSPTTTPVSIPINRNLYLNPRLQQGNQQKNDESTVSSSSTPINLYIQQQQQQKNDETSSAPRNLYLNPRLQQQHQGNLLSSNQLGQQQRNDDVKRVIEIMTKPKKKNPILVGELEPEAIRKEIMRRIEKGEYGELKNVQVISIEKEFASMSDKSLMPTKIQELGNLIDIKIGTCDGVIIDLADLKWLVEQPPATIVSSVGRESVAEMAKLVSKFSGKVWLIGTATCETYLRCQVYHPSMETDWDLQAVPITSRLPLHGVFPRMGTNGILGATSVDSLNPMNNFSSRTRCCPKCSGDYEQELAKLKESSSDEIKSNLPQWLQNAKTEHQSQVKDQEQVLKQRIQELQKKWSDTCLRDHPNYNQFPRLDRLAPMLVPLTGTYKPNMLLRQGQPAQQPRLQPPTSLQEALQSKSNLNTTQQRSLELPRSPVRTELVLGPKKALETLVPKDNEDLTVKDLLGCISSEPEGKIQEFHKGKFANAADTDSFKKLLKGLMKKAWWQPEAASAIATTITQCKVDSGSRGSVWLLFAGPDRVAKKKMASVLAEHVCGANPITIGLGSRRDDEETDMGLRGKTVLDRIVEAVRRNPSSVIVLSDIDEADMLVRGSIKRAMERGRLTDSHGREISLGNVVFVLTGNWSTANIDEHLVDEQRLRLIASRDWQLRLTVDDKRLKRRSNWLSDKDRSRRPRKESGLDLSLDLNLAMDYEEDRTDGSINSSNLTMDQEDENQRFAVMSVPHELVGPSDGAVVFKPANFGHIRREIEKTIKSAFSATVDEKITIEVEEAAVENILGGLWFGRTSLEEWAEQILIPSFHQLNSRLPSTGGEMVVRLASDRDSVSVGGGGDWLPSKIAVVVDGVGG